MADVRSAQHFTFSLQEAVEALVAQLRSRGVRVGLIEQATLNINGQNNTVQLLLINPVSEPPTGDDPKLN
jgi:hypothetical protein